MAYTPRTYTNGEDVTADDLNRIETGIDAVDAALAALPASATPDQVAAVAASVTAEVNRATAAEQANAQAIAANTTALASKVNSSTYTAGLAGKADLVGGLVPTSQIPAVALTTARVVADRAALLALTDVQAGDIAVISSGSDKGTYLLSEGSPSSFGSWVLLNAPTDVVQSVNGQVGTVVLGAADVGAYVKPGTGIPLSDLAASVQAGLSLSLTYTGTWPARTTVTSDPTAVVTWITPPTFAATAAVPPPVGGSGMGVNDIWINQTGSN